MGLFGSVRRGMRGNNAQLRRSQVKSSEVEDMNTFLAERQCTIAVERAASATVVGANWKIIAKRQSRPAPAETTSWD